MLLSATQSHLCALALIAVAGLARLPVEHGMSMEARRLNLQEEPVTGAVRERLGQAGLVAALGGFRSMVASGYYLRAYTAFERKDWAQVENDYELVTLLQPRSFHYWDHAHWNMAYNANSHYLRKAGEESESFAGWQAANIQAPYYLNRGKEFLERGIEQLPDEWRLYRLMGDLMQHREHDPCGAAEWYLRASQKPNASPWAYRAYANMLAECPGRESEAYTVLRGIYETMEKPTPSVLINLEILEDFLTGLEYRKSEPELRRAIDVRPDDYLPRAALARHLAEVQNQPEQAAEIYKESVRDHGAPSFYARKYADLIRPIPGREQEAYAILRGFYKLSQAHHREEELRAAIRELEEALDVPLDRRLLKPRDGVPPMLRK